MSLPWEVDANTLALYHCDTGSGTTLVDETGNYNATLQSSDAWSTEHKFGTHSFYSNNLYQATQATLLDTVPANGTIEFWFCPDSTIPATHTFWPLIAKWNTTGPDEYMRINFLENDQRINFFMAVGGATYNLYSTTTTWTGGQWYHVRCTWGSNGMELWVNGVKEDSNTFTGHMSNGTQSDFFICGYWSGSYRFPGKIDELRVSNIQRSDGQTEREPVGTNMKINIGGAWKDISEMKINVGGSWKNVTAVKINVGDTWKDVYG